jgi:hypothetical protein
VIEKHFGGTTLVAELEEENGLVFVAAGVVVCCREDEERACSSYSFAELRSLGSHQ